MIGSITNIPEWLQNDPMTNENMSWKLCQGSFAQIDMFVLWQTPQGIKQRMSWKQPCPKLVGGFVCSSQDLGKIYYDKGGSKLVNETHSMIRILQWPMANNHHCSGSLKKDGAAVLSSISLWNRRPWLIWLYKADENLVNISLLNVVKRCCGTCNLFWMTMGQY